MIKRFNIYRIRTVRCQITPITAKSSLLLLLNKNSLNIRVSYLECQPTSITLTSARVPYSSYSDRSAITLHSID